MSYQLIRTPFYSYRTAYNMISDEILYGPWRFVIGLNFKPDLAKRWSISRSGNALLFTAFGKVLLAIGFMVDDYSEMIRVGGRKWPRY